jgi:hypothetical protein
VGGVFGLGVHEQHGNEEGPMSTDNLFPDHSSPKKKPTTFQQRLLDYIREHKIITEEIYREKIGGRSVSAALHNIKNRGLLNPGEYVLSDKIVGSHGFILPAYRLVRESPPLDVQQKEPELDANRFAQQPDITAFAEEPEGLWGVPNPEEEPHVPEHDTPEVSSIVVGVNRNQPELIIMFKGDFKPLRHLLTHMEVRYLSMNLEPFMPKKRAE